MIKAAKVMSMWRINKAALLEYIGIDNSMAVPVMRWIGERIAMAETGVIS